MCDLISSASKYGVVTLHEINVEACCERLSQEGYRVFPLFHDFMSKYGGVYGFHSAYRNKNKSEEFFIDPEKASECIFFEKVNEYIERAMCNMIPIGECSNGYITLMYGENGAIYGGCDDYLWEYGCNLSLAIDALINGKEVVEIPVRSSNL
ncbi:hypothetical protein D4F64_24215 [Salmonella enterica subsp. enterica]|nr:hypothetical protein [Salmonella enterica]MLA12577.1 hypothetical protein [Salmonella enterica subsp. enterica]